MFLLSPGVSGEVGPEEYVDFTPEWTNLDIQNGATAGKYAFIRPNTLRIKGWFRMGSNSEIIGSIDMKFPVERSALVTGDLRNIGFAQITDNDGDDTFGAVMVRDAANPSVLQFQTIDGSPVNATSPITWAFFDSCIFDILVELVPE